MKCIQKQRKLYDIKHQKALQFKTNLFKIESFTNESETETSSLLTMSHNFMFMFYVREYLNCKKHCKNKKLKVVVKLPYI